MNDDAASMECGSETPEKRPRGRPRTRPDLDATAIAGNPTRLTVATIPYRVLARIRKQGSMTYSEISAYIAGTRMIRRDKYVDPAIYSLRRRGFIELSKAPGCRGRWSITQAGRLALRDAKPTMDAILRARRKEAEQDQARHAAHVAVQRLMGLSEEMIHGGLPDAMPVSGR